MTRTIPQHHGFNTKAPPGWDGGKNTMTVRLTYKPVAGFPDQVRFIFEVSANFPYSEPANDLGFEIQRDCTIIFSLDPKLNSRWSRQYYFITGKRNYSSLYGDTQLIDDMNFSVKAKYNASGNHNDRQQINLNIDYGQSHDDQGHWSFVPITIDPDVGNPRPGNGVLIDGPIEAVVIGSVSG